MLVRTVAVIRVVVLGLLALGCPACGGSGHAPYRHAVVAADHAIASRAGAEVMKAGGNAIDAAVATSFTLSVVRPYSCGMGGGGFMVIRLSDAGARQQRALGRDVAGEVAINYREIAPAAITPDTFERVEDKQASRYGGMAVAVPGTVAGLLHVHAKYGVLPREQIMAPAIRAAEQGFAVDDDYVEETRDLVKDFVDHPEWKQRFAFVWTRLLGEGAVKVGDTITLPEQAAALRLIARDGTTAFYGGPIGRAVVRAAHERAGVLTDADLASFPVAETTPLRFAFAGRAFLTMPPPSSGGVTMGQILGILEEAKSPTPNVFGLWDSAAIHLVAEAMKHAFADRAEWLGDPAFVDVPVERLLSREYLRDRADLIRLTRTRTPDEYGTRRSAAPAPRAPDDGGTSHFSIVDPLGNAVACTETINLEFGSLVAVEEYGFCLNNEMDDFTTIGGGPNAFGLVQSDLNRPQPGKRPLSSMTPTIVVDQDGQVELVVGASGGPRIISATTLAAINAMTGHGNAAYTVAAGRFHHQWQPDTLWFESEPPAPTLFGGPAIGMSDSGREELARYGHELKPRREIGNVQLIRRHAGAPGWDAACDVRKGGEPAGW